MHCCLKKERYLTEFSSHLYFSEGRGYVQDTTEHGPNTCCEFQNHLLHVRMNEWERAVTWAEPNQIHTGAHRTRASAEAGSPETPALNRQLGSGAGEFGKTSSI